MRLSRELPNESPYAPREALGGKDARTLARELSGMSQPEFSTAFRGSPMKRAKLRGLKRNAAVVLGNPSPDSGQAALAEDVDAYRVAFLGSTMKRAKLPAMQRNAGACPERSEGGCSTASARRTTRRAHARAR